MCSIICHMLVADSGCACVQPGRCFAAINLRMISSENFSCRKQSLSKVCIVMFLSLTGTMWVILHHQHRYCIVPKTTNCSNRQLTPICWANSEYQCYTSHKAFLQLWFMYLAGCVVARCLSIYLSITLTVLCQNCSICHHYNELLSKDCTNMTDFLSLLVFCVLM